MALDALLPMNLQLDVSGHVVHVGPTLARTRSPGHFHGRSVFQLFEFKRPAGTDTIETLARYADTALRMSFRDTPKTVLHGTIAAAAPAMVSSSTCPSG